MGKKYKNEKYYADIERGSCGMSIETLIALSELYGLSMDYIIYGDPAGREEEITDRGEAVMNILKELEPEEYECCLDMMLIYARRAGKSREKNTIGEESKQNPA